jgi:hypothetical protein
MNEDEAGAEARISIVARMLASGLSVRITQDRLTPEMCYALFEAMARRVESHAWHDFLRRALDETLDRMLVAIPTKGDDA